MNNNNTILIVDDSVTELKHLQNILEDAGYKVITAMVMVLKHAEQSKEIRKLKKLR